MLTQTRKMRRLLALFLVLGVVAAACGNDGDDGETTPEAIDGEATADDAPSEAALDEDFTVGFSLATGANPYLATMSESVGAYVQNAGGDFTVVDANLDPNKQIADIDQLVAQGVDAIAFVAFDERSVGPALERAQDAGIKVFAFGFELNYDGEPPSGAVDGQVLDDRPQMAREQAAYLNERLDGGGEVAYIDFGFPVPALQFSYQAFEQDLGQYAELSLVERFENPSDDSAGGRTQADAALTAHPDLDAIVAYSDPTALGAAAAVSSAGKDGEVLVLGTQMQPEGVEAIERGALTASWDGQPVAIGERLGELILAALAGEPESEWRTTVVVEAQAYDESNVDEWLPWSEQLAALRQGS